MFSDCINFLQYGKPDSDPDPIKKNTSTICALTGQNKHTIFTILHHQNVDIRNCPTQKSNIESIYLNNFVRYSHP